MRDPKPAVSRGLFAEISSRNGLSGELVQATWVSWMFLRHVQSECLPLVRQLPRERMGDDSARNAPAVIGTRKGQLAMKQRRRKQMGRGSRLVRKCI